MKLIRIILGFLGLNKTTVGAVMADFQTKVKQLNTVAQQQRKDAAAAYERSCAAVHKQRECLKEADLADRTASTLLDIVNPKSD